MKLLNLSFMKNINAGSSFLVLCVLFTLYFPKAGIKVANIPITFGYLLLGAASVYLLLRRAVKQNFSISLNAFYLLLCMLPFQFFSVYNILENGYSDKGMFLSFIVCFVFFPVFSVLLLSEYFDRSDFSFILSVIKKGILFVSAYGIFLFIYKQLTGSYIEIPFLTVNAGDIGELVDKHNDRGGVFKLISTFNNGNIYGVCLLMLLPLYHCLEQSKWKKSMLNLSLILTLSRTVWVGLFLYHALHYMLSNFSLIKTIRYILLFIVLVIALTFVLSLIGRDLSWIVDAKLGGRLHFLTSFKWDLFSDGIFYTIGEMTYLSIALNFGVVGLIFFVLMIAAAPLMGLLKKLPESGHELKKSILFGQIIYLVVAFIDGAILLIPVMCFYWFLTACLLSRNLYFENKDNYS